MWVELEAQAEALDAQDPLAHCRAAFSLPEDTIYLDGNSLGALPHAVTHRVQQVLEQQWGKDLIRSWNSHHWVDLPRQVGEKIAPLVGAAPGQVLCCDSLSVNLFKLLAMALALRPGRHVILCAEGDFPTDAYMAQGLAQWLGEQRCQLRTVPFAELGAALDEQVAVMMLTEVNFRSGARHDMAALTAAAHAQGALALWDLAHSAGAMPVALDACGVDLAAGCGYKFLNGGPGAPGFVYVAERHQGHVQQPLSGWFGHCEPFAFSPQYQPAPGVAAMQAGTPGILGMAALDAALDGFAGICLQQLRDKSLALAELLFAGVDALARQHPLRLLTPRAAAARGSQVSVSFAEGHALAQALIARGVVVDFREPDIVRFGLAPLYNRHSEMVSALRVVAEVLDDESWRGWVGRPRAAVT